MRSVIVFTHGVCICDIIGVGCVSIHCCRCVPMKCSSGTGSEWGAYDCDCDCSVPVVCMLV